MVKNQYIKYLYIYLYIFFRLYLSLDKYFYLKNASIFRRRLFQF